MNSCINRNTAEYQTLSKKSGLPDIILTAYCSKFLNELNRFPYLDELPGSNSSEYLKQELDIKNGGAKINKILELTGTDSIEAALIKMNDLFRDVEISLTPLNTESIVNITKKPIVSKPTDTIHPHSLEVNAPLLFSNIIHKMRTLYGIEINEVDNETIQNSELSTIPGVATAKAFVHNNSIYINTDYADIDAPIHEMMHILLGSLRASNPRLYFEVMASTSQLPYFATYVLNHPNRTLSDVAEEAFVEEFARLASAKQSDLMALDSKVKYELFYNAKRILDSILMGENSVKAYSDETIFNSSLSELCTMVDSALDAGEFKGTISLHNGEVHRLLANKKQELFEKNELEEHCNG